MLIHLRFSKSSLQKWKLPRGFKINENIFQGATNFSIKSSLM